MSALTSLFKPKSIAVIGASNTPNKVGSIVIRNLLASNFPGPIYPINPKEEKISWLQAYPDIASLPETPECAVIALPVQIALQVLEDVGKHGIKSVVMFTAGFKEIGEEGQKLELQLINTCKKHDINLLGPNCLGFVNNEVPVNVTFGQVVNNVGNLRFISQSGAIASSIFDWCEASGLGFREFVTLGNKSVITENEVLEYFKQQHEPVESAEGTSGYQPIGMYLESIVDGKRFLHLAKEITKHQPVFILKPGKSKAAAKAMQSHTGSIAGEDAIMEAALKQAGIIRCPGLEEFFDLSTTFAWEQAPEGPSVAIISNAGGPAVISADVIELEGLALAEFDSGTKEDLLEKLPRAASIMNPVDVLGDALAQRYGDALEVVLNEPAVHSVMVILTPQVMTQIEETAEIIGRLSKKSNKPVVCSFMGGSHVAKGKEILNHHKIPTFHFPERGLKTIAAMWRWQQWRQKHVSDTDTNQETPTTFDSVSENIHSILTQAKQEHRSTLNSFEANDLLDLAGIQTPPSQEVIDVDAANQFANHHGWPVVLKLVSHKLLHKTESKGVIKNISSRDQLDMAIQLMQQRRDSLDPKIKDSVSIQIQRQVQDGVEVIVGIKHDPTFGVALMFGAGGTFTELIVDRNLFILPINQNEAKQLILQSKIGKVLTGYRGDQPYALDSLADLMVRLGDLVLRFEAIEEIEINPVIVTHSQAWAVDGKAILEGQIEDVQTLYPYRNLNSWWWIWWSKVCFRTC
jgi:acetyl coenzyme A synthetase (ADP forming)-like protein